MDVDGRSFLSRVFLPKRREDGFVIVWLGLILTVLVGLAGMAVDFGNWYLHIQKTQRASDAAALAGDPYLPANVNQARTMARDTLIKNGVPRADANRAFASTNCATAFCIRQVPGHDSQLQVKVQVTVTNRFFHMLGMGRTNSFTRQAIAEYIPELHIDSGSNVLGGPEPTSSTGRWGPAVTTANRNYWMQMGGRDISRSRVTA